MRNTGTNEEVICAFEQQEKGPSTNGNGSLYFAGEGENSVLFSYGSHFPLALWMPDGKLLVNGDPCSVTTSKHRHGINQTGFTTSFDAMNRAFGWHYQDGCPKTIDHTNDMLGRAEPVPIGATATYHMGELMSWHRPATAVIEGPKGNHWIAGMDDEQYFISKLPRKVKSVEQGLQALKPPAVRKAERIGTEVHRQGEWFFILKASGSEAKALYGKMGTRFILPNPGRGNPHQATRGMLFRKHPLVSGQIRHPEHPQLKLSTLKDCRIYRAVINTATENYSVSGVD